ncbi:MAG TPA: hypothetical protein PK417_07910 [Hyphomonas sp.]|nr:hypothetical protein [Hyphomonas sp.]
MTQTETRGGARLRGRTRAEQAALRALARSAAQAGEPLAAIARRLQIPDSTLSDWALADGFRTCDLRARAEAAAVTEDATDTIRQQAEEMWEEGNDGSLGWRTAAQATLDLARVRAFALIEAGYLDAAEAEMVSVRRLARLLAFARPIAGPMGALHRRAEWEAGLERHYATLDALTEAAKAERAAREAAGLPEPPPPQPLSDEEVRAFLAEGRARRREERAWREKAG